VSRADQTDYRPERTAFGRSASTGSTYLIYKEIDIMATATWKPDTEHDELSTQDKNDLPESVFAFPKKRKEPLTDAEHVQNALARFDQVTDVSDEERDQAFANIKKAAEHYGVDVSETDWHQLGSKPHTKNASH